MRARSTAIMEAVTRAIWDNRDAIPGVIDQLGRWMVYAEIVRIIGAGRALLAAALPANRLAHGGAKVFIFGDKSPLPNTNKSGGVIAASASGKTVPVLEILRDIRDAEPTMPIIGLADANARVFRSLCTPGLFVGIDVGTAEERERIELNALGDLGEYTISELLDCLVVAAGRQYGINFWDGHENIFSGPWHQGRPLPVIIDFRTNPQDPTRVEWLVVNATRVELEGIPDAAGQNLAADVGSCQLTEVSSNMRVWIIATDNHGNRDTKELILNPLAPP